MKRTLEIVIVGAGSLGCVFAALLARTGIKVSLVARGGRARLLRERGVIIQGLEEVTVDVPVIDDPTAVERVDVLLLCTKAIGTRATLATLRHIDARAVASLQNGVLSDSLLAEVFGAERVIGAGTMIGAERHDDGSVEFTARGTTYLGEFDGTLSDRVGGLVAALDDAGLPAQVPADITSLIWSKACLAAGAFAVSAFSRRPVADVMAHPHLANAMLEIMTEVAHLAQAAGVRISDYPGLTPHAWVTHARERALAAMAADAAHIHDGERIVRVSMLQDIEAGRPIEVDEVFGHLVDEAKRLGVACPRLSFACEVLRGLSPHPALGSVKQQLSDHADGSRSSIRGGTHPG